MEYYQFQKFYDGKKVLITGHTGFKGSWLTKILYDWGAKVVGIALKPPTNPNLYDMIADNLEIESHIIDIRNFEEVNKIFKQFQPEIVFHMAAQPLVIESYKNPVYTYETNIMGTVYICECIRNCTEVKSFVNVTTDKVYQNKEWEWGYREYETLNGQDPYSNSKSCSELVTDSYKQSFFQQENIAVSTVRAGNVIGGGDFAENRIIPDCLKAAEEGNVIIIRNPSSIRPYQHVLEALSAYLLIAKEQYENIDFSGAYNVGPELTDCIQTSELVEVFCRVWGEGVGWKQENTNNVHEANFLKLDCSKIKSKLGWNPKLNIQGAIEMVVEWQKCYMKNENIAQCMKKQIDTYFTLK